jgi:hypothetical protein
MIDGTCGANGGTVLQDIFNEDNNVQGIMNQYGYDPLACAGTIGDGGGQGVEWGGVFHECEEVTVYREVRRTC